MPVIRISEATWKRMKRHAVPLEDSAEDVVKRALDALDQSAGRARNSPPATSDVQGSEEIASAPQETETADGPRLPQKAFRIPLIETLCGLGGGGTTRQIRDTLEKKMAPRLGPSDHALVSSGDPRWWNAVCWERNALANEGLLKKDSPRGNWELSEQGLQSIGRLYEFVFVRDYATSVDSQVAQFMKGQTVPGPYFPQAVREKWPIEAAKPN